MRSPRKVKNARDLVVLLAIASFADADGSNAWPSHQTVAERAHCSVPAVRRSIAHLRRDGHLTQALKAGPKGVNVYVVVAAAECAASEESAGGGDCEVITRRSGEAGAGVPSDHPSITSEGSPDHLSITSQRARTSPDQSGAASDHPSSRPSDHLSIDNHPLEGPPPAPARTREADGDQLASMLTRRGIDPDDARVAEALAAHGTRHVARAALLCDAFDQGDPVAALLGGLTFEARRDAGASHEEAETAGIAAASAARQPVAHEVRA
jgi:hypothetical protein